MPTWTLAIETVATAGSVALLHDDTWQAETPLPAGVRSARTLAAAVQTLWQSAGRPSIDLVGVAQGPGSFTGLRVGVTTAKALAYAWKSTLLGVNSLDVIAAQSEPLSASVHTLHVILDAQRQELFLATYQRSAAGSNGAGEWQRAAAETIISSEDWLKNIRPETQVAGPALAKLRSRLPEAVPVAAERDWQPRAETVARLARCAHQSGAADQLWPLVPQYGRLSYAEEARGGRREAGDEGKQN